VSEPLTGAGQRLLAKGHLFQCPWRLNEYVASYRLPPCICAPTILTIEQEAAAPHLARIAALTAEVSEARRFASYYATPPNDLRARIALVRKAIAETRRLYVGTPPNVDECDALAASVLSDVEERIRAALRSVAPSGDDVTLGSEP
jgi:hypothetical protein